MCLFHLECNISGDIRTRAFVCNTKLETLLAYKLAFDKKKEEGAQSDAVIFDKKPPVKPYGAFEDDHFVSLHPARFERYPLGSREAVWQNMPVERHHKYKDIDLSHAGAGGQVSEKVILLLHNRKNLVTLKHFYPMNVTVTRLPMVERRLKNDGSYMDYNWAPINSLKGVKDSVVNYGISMHNLWPLDESGYMFLKLYNAWNWLPLGNDNMRIQLIEEHFNSVIAANCSRVGRKAPMDYDEMEASLKKMLDMKLLPSTPVNHFNQQGEGTSGAGGKGGEKSSENKKGGKGDKKTEVPRGPGGVYICYDYNNKGAKCRRDRTRNGCKDDSKEYHHICLWKDYNTNEYCFKRHSKKDHREKSRR